MEIIKMSGKVSKVAVWWMARAPTLIKNFFGTKKLEETYMDLTPESIYDLKPSSKEVVCCKITKSMADPITIWFGGQIVDEENSPVIVPHNWHGYNYYLWNDGLFIFNENHYILTGDILYSPNGVANPEDFEIFYSYTGDVEKNEQKVDDMIEKTDYLENKPDWNNMDMKWYNSDFT
jgi:hypothetical protein